MLPSNTPTDRLKSISVASILKINAYNELLRNEYNRFRTLYPLVIQGYATFTNHDNALISTPKAQSIGRSAKIAESSNSKTNTDRGIKRRARKIFENKTTLLTV